MEEIREKREEKYLKRLEEIQQKYNNDTEARHGEEDYLLCELLNELGYSKLVDQYNKTR